jgi:DNA-binding GntR family transcriptional regulator
VETARTRLRYLQVVDLVEGLIAERGLRPGDLLPTQQELAGLAGVSLITVRRALDELSRAGRVIGHQGVGTFVARPRIVAEPASVGGLLATLAEQGAPLQVETEVLEVRPARPGAAAARALGLGPGESVWQIVRLRHIDGAPRVVEQALVPQALAPGLDRRRAELAGSLYELLARDHGLADDHEEQYLEVRAPGTRERRLLRLGARARVVRLRGVSYTADDLAFDCFEQVYPADEFVFSIAGQTARRLLRPADLGDWGVAATNGRREDLRASPGDAPGPAERGTGVAP